MPVHNFTWKDLPAVLDFVETARFSGRGQVGFAPTDARELWRRVFQETLAQPGLAPQENCFLFETDGQLQGFCRLSPELAIGRTVLELEVTAAPHFPKGRKEDFIRQVERELIQRAVARSRELGARVVHTCIPQGLPRGRLLEEADFSPARVYWDMGWQQEPVPQPLLPEGFYIRHFRPEDTQALTDAQNAAFGGSWGFCPNTVDQIRYRSSMSNTRHEGILLLRHGEQIAAYCWTSFASAMGRTKGIIAMIGVVPDYRGRGLGRPILLAAMEYLWSAGAAEIGLQVDGSNTPAIRLYVSAGFEKVRELQWFQLRLPANGACPSPPAP